MLGKFYEFQFIKKKNKIKTKVVCYRLQPQVIDYNMLRPFLVPYDELPEHIRCNIKREDYVGDDE